MRFKMVRISPRLQRLVWISRLTSNSWDLCDTRHAVFQPSLMTDNQVEEGCWRAYDQCRTDLADKAFPATILMGHCGLDY
jgi:hypothetical protein